MTKPNINQLKKNNNYGELSVYFQDKNKHLFNKFNKIIIDIYAIIKNDDKLKILKTQSDEIINRYAKHYFDENIKRIEKTISEPIPDIIIPDIIIPNIPIKKDLPDYSDKVSITILSNIWSNLIDKYINQIEISADQEKNQLYYNNWHNKTADSISIYDVETKTYQTGWLGNILQNKLKSTNTNKNISPGIDIETSPITNDNGEVATIWLAKKYDGNRQPFKSSLIIADYKFKLEIKYFGGFFTGTTVITNMFGIDYDWIERPVTPPVNLNSNNQLELFRWKNENSTLPDYGQYQPNELNIAQYFNSDPKFIQGNVLFCEYTFPFLATPKWYEFHKWTLWPAVLILQSIVFGVIKLFSIEVVENSVKNSLKGSDFLDLFRVLRSISKENRPIYYLTRN